MTISPKYRRIVGMNIPTIGDIAVIIEKLKNLKEKETVFIKDKFKDVSVEECRKNLATAHIRKPIKYTGSIEELIKAATGLDVKLPEKELLMDDLLVLGSGDMPTKTLEKVVPTLPIDELRRLLNEFLPELLLNTEISADNKRYLQQIKKSLSRELERKEKCKNGTAKIIETIKKIKLLRGMPKGDWPKKIKDLINEIVRLLFPYWDYLKGKGSLGEKEQSSIEALIRAGKPSYLDMVTQELEKIKYKMEIEAKQKDSDKPAGKEQDIPPTKDKKKKAKIACLFKKIIGWIFKKTSHVIGAVIIAIIGGLIVAILVDIFADFGWIERIKAVIYKILQLN